MKQFLFILAVFISGTCVTAFAQEDVPFDASTSGDGSNIIAFVGKKIFVRRDESFPPEIDETVDEIIIHMDGRYESRYQIEKLISGNYEGDRIDFHAYDHYGTPRFSEIEDVLLFVHNRPKGYVHSKYNYYAVHKTTDGDWAACGSAYVQNDPEEENKEPLEAISFLNPVEVNISSLMLSVADELEADEFISDAERVEWQAELDEENMETDGLYQAPIWKREGMKATCLMGTRVADLYKFQNETRFLRDKREEMCKERYSENLDALGRDYKAKRDLIKDCTSLLEIQNLP